MKRTLFLALALAGSAQAQAQWTQSSHASIGGWQPVSSWCDTPGRVLAVTVPNKSSTAVKLARWVGGKINVQNWHLGRADAGAGQVYTPPVPAGQTQRQNSQYFIHSSNTENTVDPQYHMTSINEYVVPTGRFQCRYVPGATLLAATAKHTVIVWESGVCSSIPRNPYFLFLLPVGLKSALQPQSVLRQPQPRRHSGSSAHGRRAHPHERGQRAPHLEQRGGSVRAGSRAGGPAGRQPERAEGRRHPQPGTVAGLFHQRAKVTAPPHRPHYPVGMNGRTNRTTRV